MQLFDAPTLRAFSLRHPTLSPQIVNEAADWVARLHARENLENPSAVLESILQKRESALAVDQAAQRTPAPVQRAVSDRSRNSSLSHADPEVAHRELAKIRALLDNRPLHESTTSD